MNAGRNRKIIYWLLPLAGTLLCLQYVRSAARDVVYSDCIRLVNSYPPDVWNPDKLFVSDVLTYISINYLRRIVSVEFFGFTITLKHAPGMVSLELAGWVFAIYGESRKIGYLWSALLMAMMFSLNKWEILTNGGGWSHFFAFACFYYHKLVPDRTWTGEEKKRDRLKLLVLPWLIMLGTVGSYCGVYATTLLLSYGFYMVMDRRKSRDYPDGRGQGFWDTQYLAYVVCVLIPLLLYMLNSPMVVEEYVGITGCSFGTILIENSTFPVRFLLRFFSGVLVGGEELGCLMERSLLSNRVCYALGLLVVCGYLMTLWLNFRLRLYGRTIMPLILLARGGMNHVITLIPRYILEKENYALSSYCTLQFQVGILGIILAFALVWQLRGGTNREYRWPMAPLCPAILVGNGYTIYREIQKALNGEESFERKTRLALEVPRTSREELRDRGEELETGSEYHKGLDKIQDIFRILGESKLNIFREYNGGQR